MSNEPSFIVEAKAYWTVVPVSISILFASLSVAIGRVFWAAIHDLGAVEALGLFSPWFGPWVICITISFFISSRSEEINSKAKELQKKRSQAKYGDRY